MQVEVIAPHALSAEDIGQWLAIQQATPALASPVLSPMFAKVVSRHRPDTKVAIARDEDGRAFAFLPFQGRPGGLARALGAPFGDYQAIITLSLESLDTYRFLAGAGIKTIVASGLINAEEISGTERLDLNEAYRIVLNGDHPSDYLEGLRVRNPKRFKNWRRLGHKTERELGPLSMKVLDHDNDILRQLLDWKAAQMVRTGATNVLRPKWVRAMMADLMDVRDGEFSGLLLTMWAGDILLGGHFGVRLGSVFHPWMAANNPNYPLYSPGQTFILQAIAMMDQLGLTTYDLGPGHAHYKAPFCNETPLVASGRIITQKTIGIPPPRGFIGKIMSRIDYISSVELTLAGRIGGVLAVASEMGARMRQTEQFDGE